MSLLKSFARKQSRKVGVLPEKRAVDGGRKGAKSSVFSWEKLNMFMC